MILLFLVVIGLFAGMVDAIAGGGGLITLPVLLSMGLPPSIALGTNKFQGVAGTLVATLKYYRHGYISLKKVYPSILAGLIGSILGVITIEAMNSDSLRKMIPIILVIILIYSICSPRMGQADHPPKINELLFYLVFGFLLGFYDGFFGPGTGSFWVFVLTFLLGLNLIKATAYTKVFNLNSSLVATVCFAMTGNIDYRVALCMGSGQLIGGRFGAHLAITKGARLIRPIFVSVVSMTILTLVYKNYRVSGEFVWISQHGIRPFILMAAAVILSSIILYIKLIQKQKSKIVG
jgi:uncharacterized membrane protein YfcA